jgi:transposase
MTSGKLKPWKSKEILEDLYVVQELSMRTIAGLLGTSAPTIKYWIDKLDIPAREFNIGELHKGKNLSEEHKQKISSTVKEKFENPENHPMYGKKHSAEARKKMSEARMKYLNHKELPQCEDG